MRKRLELADSLFPHLSQRIHPEGFARCQHHAFRLPSLWNHEPDKPLFFISHPVLIFIIATEDGPRPSVIPNFVLAQSAPVAEAELTASSSSI